MCVAKSLEANVRILSHPLIMSHRFTDALNGDTKWGQGYAVDIQVWFFFKMADWLISQMVFSEAVNHTLLSYSCSYEYYPRCAILYCHLTEHKNYTPLEWLQFVIFIFCVASVFYSQTTVHLLTSNKQ